MSRIRVYELARELGIESRLLVMKIRQMGINGVHLDVSRRNLNAIGFYGGVGFKVLESGSSSIRFARKLSD